jgi:hypothetical protein
MAASAALQKLQTKIQQSSQQLSWDPGIFASTLAYLQTVDPAQQQAIVDQLIQAIDSGPNSDLIGAGATPDAWLQKAQAASNAAAQSPASLTASAAAAQTAIDPKTGGYTADQKPPVSTAPVQVGTPFTPGTDYPTAFGYTAATDPASLAALAGMDPATLQAQYADYQKQVATLRDTWTGHGALPADKPPDQLNLRQFAQMAGTALQGQWQPALDALDYEWNAQYGERMPGELRQQLLTALNGMDKEQQQAVLSAEMTYVTGLQSAQKGTGVGLNMASLASTLTGVMPQSIGTITTQYAQANPNIPAAQASEVAARKSGYIQWLTDHHVAPTPALLDQLLAMPVGSASSPEPGTDYAYLAAMPSDVNGMTWGQKDIAMGNLGSTWKQYFSREPTQKELLWSIGKTPDEVQSFINNSQSSIPGMTIGRYHDYTTFIDSLGTSGASSTTHAFSGALDDSMIKSLHEQVTAASTGKASPGKM